MASPFDQVMAGNLKLFIFKSKDVLVFIFLKNKKYKRYGRLIKRR
jgi:hypothetical protein